MRSASPYAHLTREDFDAVVDFVATGGYALRAYDRYARLRKTEDGKLASGASAPGAGIPPQCRRDRGRPDGGDPAARQAAGRRARAGASWASWRNISSSSCRWAILSSSAGEVLRFEGLRETGAYVTRASDPEAEIPSYNGGKFPLSTFLAQRVREMVSSPERWHSLPEPVQEWLKIQEWRSVIPAARPACWSRRFRAATAIIWSAIPSKGGWRTRPWACC